MNIAGPPVLLPTRAVVPLSMVLHELTTNAAKYGALSTRRGRIDIAWQLSRGSDRSVELGWQEHGGPKVKASAFGSAGFGTRLIYRVISHDLDGKTKVAFDPEGVRWTLTFPLGDLAGARAATSGSAIE